jgi:uroporphyrinogen III methyltransferase/synthase
MSRDRRLRGAIVVLTRRRVDDRALAQVLRQRGAEVIEMPCVRTEPLADAGELARAVAALGSSDLLVLTSRTGADAVADVAPGGGVVCGVAAVGDATAERAGALGMRVRFVASRADGATLGHELPLPRGEILLARSDLADRELPATLLARGARVREVAAYRTVAGVEGDPGAVRRAVARGPVTIVVASPSAVDALVDAVDLETLRRATIVAIGPRTARHVQDRAGVVAIVAEAPAAGDIASAIPTPETEEAAS